TPTTTAYPMPCMFFFSSRRRHTRWPRDWSSDVCSSDLSRAITIRVARIVMAREHEQQRVQRLALLGIERSEELVVDPLGDRPERSEERRVGKECRTRGAPDQRKKKKRERRIVV